MAKKIGVIEKLRARFFCPIVLIMIFITSLILISLLIFLIRYLLYGDVTLFILIVSLRGFSVSRLKAAPIGKFF